MWARQIVVLSSLALCLAQDTTEKAGSCSMSTKYSCLNKEKETCSRSTYGRYCESCKGCDPRESPRPEDQCQFTTGCDDCTCGDPAKKPNVVVFVTDDGGWNDISSHGSCKAKTPDIDAFLYNSIIMKSMYVSRVCSPSRGAFMSGKYPHKEGMDQAAILGGQPYGWPLKSKFLSNYMKDMCYKTYMVGKWNLGLYKKAYWPKKRGFDCYFGSMGSHQSYWNNRVLDPALTVSNISVQAIATNPTVLTSTFGKSEIGYDFRDEERMAYEFDGTRATDNYDNRVVEHIQKHNCSCPMFLVYTHPAPHADNNNQIPALDKYIPQNVSNIRRAKTLGLNAEASNSFGIMVDALAKKGILNNTYIIYFSDNGADGVASAGSSYPLRGMKFTSLEGGVRSSCAIWGPNVKSGRVVEEPMHVTDLMPTIVRMAGGLCGKDKLKDIDGKDQYDTIFNGQPSARNEIVHTVDVYGNTSAVSMKINGTWFKYLKNTFLGGALDQYVYPSDRDCTYNVSAVYNSLTYKALNSDIAPEGVANLRQQVTIECPQTSDCNLAQPPHACLHKIKDDPCENTNVAAQYPLVVSLMEAKIALEIERAAVPRFPPFEPRADPKYWCNEWTNYGDCLGLQ